MLHVPSWFDESCVDLLPEVYQTLADCIGLDSTLKVAALLGGGSSYCPNLKQAISQAKMRRINAEYTGYNVKELARKYDVSERWIYEIVSRAQKNTQ